MNKKILIVKTGSTYPSLVKRQGDFEDWIITGLGLDRDRMQVVDVVTGAALPRADAFGGVVITGSHAMVTQRRPWSERTAGWLGEAITRGIPLLGICYGHQLLAHALGGEVADNPSGLHMGTVPLLRNEAGRTDALLGGWDEPLNVHVCHTQSVIRLPEQAVLLGWSAQNPHQAFRVGSHAWGVQFHPEFNARAVSSYVRYARRRLEAQGQDPGKILQTIHDTPVGGWILKRFAEICGGERGERVQPA